MFGAEAGAWWAAGVLEGLCLETELGLSGRGLNENAELAPLPGLAAGVLCRPRLGPNHLLVEAPGTAQLAAVSDSEASPEQLGCSSGR